MPYLGKCSQPLTRDVTAVRLQCPVPHKSAVRMIILRVATKNLRFSEPTLLRKIDREIKGKGLAWKGLPVVCNATVMASQFRPRSEGFFHVPLRSIVKRDQGREPRHSI